MNAALFSLYWDNLDDRVPYYQKKVFDHFQIPLFQHRIDGLDHGAWMDWVLNHYEDLDATVFFDIDCIPLDIAKVTQHITTAVGGTLVGNEQASNHLDASRLFAAPSFLAVARRIWKLTNKMSCKAHYDGDVAQLLTDTWEKRGIPVKLLPVTDFEVAKWDLPGRPQSYGIGTTYDDAVYHLFECRTNENVERFIKKCEGVLSA
jgi:hypothetical protein